MQRSVRFWIICLKDRVFGHPSPAGPGFWIILPTGPGFWITLPPGTGFWIILLPGPGFWIILPPGAGFGIVIPPGAGFGLCSPMRAGFHWTNVGRDLLGPSLSHANPAIYVQLLVWLLPCKTIYMYPLPPPPPKKNNSPSSILPLN